MTKEYNGWSNRETWATWATMLHINNDQALYEIAREWSKNTFEEYDGEPDYFDGVWTLGQTIQEWVEGLLTLENVSGNQDLWLMLTDIGSLYRVNWQEIAENLLDQVKNEQVSA